MKVALVVEGEGEVQALPIIWRYCCPHMHLLSNPYRLSRGKGLTKEGKIKPEEWQKIFQLLRRRGAEAVLVLMDADDLCPKEKAPSIRRELESIAGVLGLKLGFCLAEPEYEGWFLAAADLIGLGQPPHPIPRGCKEEIRRRRNGAYSPVVDQPSLTSKLVKHLNNAALRAPSLEKLLREIQTLCYCI